MYLRVILYEVAAVFPSSILIIPWAILRERITSRDISVFTDGSGKRTLTLYVSIAPCLLTGGISITIGAALTPVVFAAVFGALRAPVHTSFLTYSLYSTRMHTVTSTHIHTPHHYLAHRHRGVLTSLQGSRGSTGRLWPQRSADLLAVTPERVADRDRVTPRQALLASALTKIQSSKRLRFTNSTACRTTYTSRNRNYVCHTSHVYTRARSTRTSTHTRLHT